MGMAPAFGRKSVGKLDAYLANLWMAGGVDMLVGGTTLDLYCERTSGAKDSHILLNDGSINTGLLLAELGAAGTVQAINDQSNNNRFFSQGTSANQPAIVSGSAYLGWLQFDASNDGFASASSFGGGTGVTVFFKGKLRSTASLQIILEHSINYNSSDAFGIYYDNSISRLIVASHRSTGSQYAISEFNVTMTTDAVFCARIDRSQTTGALQCVLFLNGTKQTRTGSTGETGTVPSGNFASTSLFLASRNAASLFASLNLYNLAIYSAALSDADCSAISALL